VLILITVTLRSRITYSVILQRVLPEDDNVISRAGPHPWQGPLPLVVLSSIVSLCFFFPSSLGLRMHNIGTIRTAVRHSSTSNKVTSSNQVAK